MQDKPQESPFLLRHIKALFFNPKKFFSSGLNLGTTTNIVLVSWIYGIAYSISKLAERTQKANSPDNYPDFVYNLINATNESWLAYWAWILVVGASSGLLLYWLGGWTYKIRIRWSGDSNPDKKIARQVNVYSALVSSVPLIAGMLFASFFYPNYNELKVLSWIDYLIVIPYLWSIIISYIGVKTLFTVSKGKALFWFLILPMGSILMAILLLGLLSSSNNKNPILDKYFDEKNAASLDYNLNEFLPICETTKFNEIQCFKYYGEKLVETLPKLHKQPFLECQKDFIEHYEDKTALKCGDDIKCLENKLMLEIKYINIENQGACRINFINTLLRKGATESEINIELVLYDEELQQEIKEIQKKIDVLKNKKLELLNLLRAN